MPHSSPLTLASSTCTLLAHLRMRLQSTPLSEAHGRWIGFGMGLAGIEGLVVASSAGSRVRGPPAQLSCLPSSRQRCACSC